MEDQHKKIIGYRDLNQEEIDAINKIKETGIAIGELCKQLEKIPDVDKRWLAIGVTQLQQGLMAVTRSVAKPMSF